jgi:uncharacterized protein
VLLEEFEDAEAGGFYFTARSHERLILRPKPGHDQATASGNAVAAWALGRLAVLTAEPRFARAAERTVACFYPAMRELPGGFAAMAIALGEQLELPALLVLRGEAGTLARWQAELAREYLPATLVVALPDCIAGLPEPLDKPARRAPASAWLCRGATCLEPIDDLVELRKAIKEKA